MFKQAGWNLTDSVNAQTKNELIAAIFKQREVEGSFVNWPETVESLFVSSCFLRSRP